LTAARQDTSVTGDIAVTANFAINVYTLTYTAGTNGLIDGLSQVTQTVAHGSDATPVTAVPDEGYHFVDWSDGILTAARQDTSVTGDIAVTANFAINVYTLTYTAGTNGLIDGLAQVTQTVAHGSDGTPVTAVPDEGYHFVDWSDGTVTAARQETSVTGDIAVTANFAINEYRVEFQTDDTEGASLSGALVQTVTYGSDCTPVEALPPAGYNFLGWTGGYTGAENPLTVTDVTADLVITANFHMQQVACGSEFVLAAKDVSLVAFHFRPKIYTRYTHPLTGNPGKATAKVLTQIDKDVGCTTIVCEWIRKIRLYDTQLLRWAQKDGESAATWAGANQAPLVMDVHVSSREVEDQSVQPLALAVPVIDDIVDGGQDAKGNDTLVITGQWFGLKRPRVWREFVVQGRNGEVIKHQAMKVVAPTDDNTACRDSAGKPAFMDPATGASQAIVVVPAKEPKGDLNGVIVLENRVGLATGDDPTEIP
jgi:uncharacterized repeat protein (TIGR02543 family)